MNTCEDKLCIPLENSYIHLFDVMELQRGIVYPSRKQLYSSRLFYRPWLSLLCIPLENSYIHRSLKQVKDPTHCVSLSKTVIFIYDTLLKQRASNCVSLSKTVIFIPACRALQVTLIVYPSRKQLYSSIYIYINLINYCVSLSKTVIFIVKSLVILSLRIVYPSRKQLYSSIYF